MIKKCLLALLSLASACASAVDPQDFLSADLSGCSDGAGRPFTVDDMLSLEGIGDGVIVPQQGVLIFEKQRALKTTPVFAGGGRLQLKARSHLYMSCLEEGCRAKPLTPERSDVATWLASVSPDGSRLLYFTLKDGDLGLGVYSFSNRRHKDLDLSPAYGVMSAFNEPIWEDPDTILISTASNAEPPPEILFEAGTARILQKKTSDNWSSRSASPGVTSTRAALGGQAHVPDGELIRLNVAAGRRDVIATGVFRKLLFSPDGRYVALLQDMGGDQRSQDGIVQIGPPLDALELIILDTENNNKPVYRCRDCSILKDSLSWREDSRAILFYGRVKSPSWDEATYYQVSLDIKTEEMIVPAGYAPAIDLASGRHLQVFSYWLREDPLLYLYSTSSGRSDWRRLTPEGAIAITSPMDRPPTLPLGVDQDQALFWYDQSLWVSSGQAAERVRNYRQEGKSYAPRYSRRSDGAIVPELRGDLFILNERNDNGASALVGLQPATGRLFPIIEILKQARVLDVDAASGRAAFAVQTPSDQGVFFSDQNGVAVPVLSFNSHLNGIVRPEALSFSYENQDGVTLNGFLIMPPEWGENGRRPVVVWSYPWVMYGTDWSSVASQQMWNPIGYSIHPLIGKGYAVILPSMPAPPLGVKQDLMKSFPGNILPALERAHELGFVDKERAAIAGISYGSYSTAGTIAQTDQFKAAITLANTQYDLASFHSSLSYPSRGLPDQSTPYYLWPYTESFLHNPPWKALDLYVANSPYHHVENISTPWLMLQGDLDSLNGLQQAEMMFSALAREGKTAQIVRYWGEGHDIRGEANIRDSWRRIFLWLDRYLASPSLDGAREQG